MQVGTFLEVGMDDHVYRVIEVVGTSQESIEAAVRNAVRIVISDSRRG